MTEQDHFDAEVKVQTSTQPGIPDLGLNSSLFGCLVRLITYLKIGTFCYAVENLLAMHGYLFRCLHANANLIAFDPEHGNSDIVAYHQGLTHSASQNQHDSLPCSEDPPSAGVF